MSKITERKGLVLSKRQQNRRKERKTFIIVCEGKKTEPNYFKQFRVYVKVRDIDIIGLGANTITVVEEAIQQKQENPSAEVWGVFDRDSFQAQNFNGALNLAKRKGIKIAYSNQAFEIWFLLHFHYHTTGTNRSLYKKMLSHPKRLGFTYAKKDTDMYDILKDRQAIAIQNAERLLQSYSPHHNPEKDNPCTTVHHLVQALNEAAV